MPHAMIDIETLDTRVTSVVLAIGAVIFEPADHKIIDTLYVETSSAASIDEQIYRGRTVSGSTIRWWMQQTLDAKKLFAGVKNAPNTGLTEALTSLAEFFNMHGHPATFSVWGNGSDFDNAILSHAYEQYQTDTGAVCPWKYSQNRCYRTLKNLGIGPRRPVNQIGTPHNALHDALSQTNHLMEILECLASRP